MPLALTLGEPAGIGPDIALAAWRRRAEFDLAPLYLLADPALMQRRAERIAPDVPIAVIEPGAAPAAFGRALPVVDIGVTVRSEEHTSELQSRRDLVCRLLLEKKN